MLLFPLADANWIVMLVSLILGCIAGCADLFGGLILVHRRWNDRALRYFIALGAGFMLAVAVLDMMPESMHYSPKWAPLLVIIGYCAIHVVEHTIPAHFHMGEETHTENFIHSHTGVSVMLGLAAHALFDGVAIGSGFVVSNWLGWLIFTAIILHKIPEGFTVASVMLASGGTRRAAVLAASSLTAATVAGVLIIDLLPHWVFGGLPISAGTTIYVAASDLIPEINREHSLRMALVFFLGIALFIAIRAIAPV